MEKTFLLYGANGYTGELITRLAAEKNLKPMLAGRNEAKIKELAEKFDMPFRICFGGDGKIRFGFAGSPICSALCRTFFFDLETNGRSLSANRPALS